MSKYPDLRLNGPVLLQQIHALGEVGTDPVNGGRTRIALTDAEKTGRDQVVAWMKELGLQIQVDRIGNIFGTLRSADAPCSRAPLMMGMTSGAGHDAQLIARIAPSAMIFCAEPCRHQPQPSRAHRRRSTAQWRKSAPRCSRP